MTTVNVLFNSDKTEVAVYFASPQDPEIYPGYGVIESSDPRWREYYNAQPELLQRGLPSPD